MILFESLLVLLITAGFTVIFAVGFRRHTDWRVLFPFFLILFLATWATGIWLTPMGPTLRGTFWIPFLVVGLLYALLLTALIPPSRPPHPLREEGRKADEGRETLLVLDVFFLMLVVALGIVIIIRYLFVP
jgi:hypothetical protein